MPSEVTAGVMDDGDDCPVATAEPECCSNLSAYREREQGLALSGEIRESMTIQWSRGRGCEDSRFVRWIVTVDTTADRSRVC